MWNVSTSAAPIMDPPTNAARGENRAASLRSGPRAASDAPSSAIAQSSVTFFGSSFETASEPATASVSHAT
jgi:hypothetical protein